MAWQQELKVAGADQAMVGEGEVDDLLLANLVEIPTQ